MILDSLFNIKLIIFSEFSICFIINKFSKFYSLGKY